MVFLFPDELSVIPGKYHIKYSLSTKRDSSQETKTPHINRWQSILKLPVLLLKQTFNL